MKIWVTSKNGFISKNIQEYFNEEELVVTSSKQVDIRSHRQVREFIKNNNDLDMIINASSFGGGRLSEDNNSLFKETVSAFSNLSRLKNENTVLYNIGSGAEYGRSASIDGPNEEKTGRPPNDAYGRAKWLIAREIEKQENCYNLRVFGCFGKHEKETRFIQSCLSKDYIEIHNDVVFSFIYVEDLCKTILETFKQRPDFKSINMCYEESFTLSKTKNMIDKLLNKNSETKIINDVGKNYYGTSIRLSEFIDSSFSKSLEKYLVNER